MPKPDQDNALAELKLRVASRSEPPTRKQILEYNDVGSTEDQYLLRFLLEASCKVDAAEKLLVKDVLWRQECDISAIQRMTESEVLGDTDPSAMFDAYASYQYGFDKLDRPVVYVHCARQDFSKVLKLVGFKGFMKFHTWWVHSSYHSSRLADLNILLVPLSIQEVRADCQAEQPPG
jgi:hypothetical protein